MPRTLALLVALAAAPALAQPGVAWRAAVPDLLTVDVSPDGSRIATGAGVPGTYYPTRLQVRSAAGGSLLLDLDGDDALRGFDPPDAVALDEGGGVLLSSHSFYDGSTGGGNGLKYYRRWNTATGEADHVNAGYFLVDVDILGGRFAFVNAGLRDVRVRDLASGAVLATVAAGGDVTALAFSPDSLLLATGAESTLDDGVVRFHPLGGGPARTATFSDAVPHSLAFSADGRFVVVGTYSTYSPGSRLVVVRVSDAAVVLNVDVPYAGALKADFTEDGARLVVRVSGPQDLLEVRRVSDGAVVLSENLGPPPARPYVGTTLDVQRVPGTGLVAYGKPDTLVVRDFSRAGGAVAADGAPTRFALTVAPNPAAGRSSVRVTLPEAQALRVEVYDALGRSVARLHDGPLAAGPHAFALDAARLPPGLYVVRITGGGVSASRTVTVAH